MFYRRVFTMAAMPALAWLLSAGCEKAPSTTAEARDMQAPSEQPPKVTPAQPAPSVASEAPKPVPLPAPVPQQVTVKLPCIADTHVATYQSRGEDERIHAYGKADSLKMKHKENFPLLKFDTSAIPANATVKKASIFVHINDPDPDFFLNHVSISTVPTDWVEGTEGVKTAEHDEACLLWPGPRMAKWGWVNDGDILGSVFGNGGNVTSVTRAVSKGEQWWEIAVPGRVVDALRKDQPGGVILQDEEIKRQGKYANMFLNSRENAGGMFAPYMEVTYAVEDTRAPGVPEIVSAGPGPGGGSVLLAIKCSGDDGDEGTALGFDLTATDDAGATVKVPRYSIPRPGAAGTMVKGIVESLPSEENYTFTVSAYDEAGNRSGQARSVAVRPRPAKPRGLADFKPIELKAGGPLKVSPELLVYAVDGLVRVDPVNGQVLTGQGYKVLPVRDGNHVFNGAEQRVEIFGARGEIIGLNLIFEAAAPVEVSIKPSDLTGPEGAVISSNALRLHRVIYSEAGGRYYAEVTPPDPGPYYVPSKDPVIPGQTNQAVAVDIYVPTDAVPGEYTGTFHIGARGPGGEVLTGINVCLKVYPAVIPDEVTFLVELNAYGTGDKEYFYAVHRLAHLNRLGYNVLSYGHKGRQSAAFVPKVEGEGKNTRVTDWGPWDEWLGPLLDGSLFTDMPRKGVPIPHFYLPLFENWPMPLHAHYTNQEIANRPPSPADPNWAKWCMDFARSAPLITEAFDEAWKEGNRAIAAEFRRHFEEKAWTRTQFQVFLNNKYYFESGSVSYWTLDEPQCAHDFRALDYIYRTFGEPFAGSPLKVVSRGDISRPQYLGDMMDGTPNLLINSSGAYYSYTPLMQRYNVLKGFTTWLYGGGCGLTGDPVSIDALMLKSWCMGADGCMPYWTSFSGDNTWVKGSDLRQVYHGNQHGYGHAVVGSVRLNAMRRGQLDGELMNLLAKKRGWDRWEAARTVLVNLNLTTKIDARGADDPGRISFDAIDAAALAALRRAVLEELAH